MCLNRSTFNWLIGFLGTSAAIAISYRWLDRPVALWVHNHLRPSHHEVLDQVGHIPNLLVPLAILGLVLLGLRAMTGRLLSTHQTAALICCIAVIFAEAFKDRLKYFFGRTWPETWLQNNPSFIRNGAYGFHFMHDGSAYQSFPSGHMGAAWVVLTVLWICYPTFRWLYLTAGFMVGAGLVATNYHFLSDVLAGAFVGVSTGWIALAIWKASARFDGQSLTDLLQCGFSSH
jgi:membrane-associated phospholipid phosphatase